MLIKKFFAFILIFISLCLFIILPHLKTGKISLPIVKMDTGDYIPGIIIINVSEDTWIGNDLLPGGCQWSPCSNGEKYCEKNCNFSHGGCQNVGGTYIWVGKGSGYSPISPCGVYDSEKHACLWFNMSEGKTANGNYIEIPWYLIKNATMKLWVATASNCQNISLRPVLPNDNKNTVNETIHNLVYKDHYYVSGEYYTENSTFFGSQIQVMCPTVNTTSEWNITDYVINQTRYGNDVFVQLKALSDFISWSVSFSSKEHTNESQRPYLQIILNSAVPGDGYCTPLNETIENSLQDCAPTNYIEVNGTTFTQPEAINITGWSSNSSSDTYLWNNYNGTLQSMLPTGNGTQTNITQSSNLNSGVYNVSCNSTWNSTLVSKTFTVVTTTIATTTTVPPSGGGGGGSSIKTTTTTSTTTVVTTTITTTIAPTTTTTIQTTTTTIPVKPLKFWEKKTSLWIIGITIIVLVIIISIVYVIYKRREKVTVIEFKLEDFGYEYE